MEPCVSLLTRLFLIAVIWGLHVGGVAINRGNEIVKYKSCPEDTKPVFVDLKCPFQFSTASSSQLITTKWTDITHYPKQTTVVNINNNGTLLPGDAYLNANITRLSTDRLDGSIRLELQNTPIGDLRTIECEVYVFGDSPNLDTSTTTVINTDPCLSVTTPAPCNCPTSSCKTLNCTTSCVIHVPEKLGPGLSIALALIALVTAVFNIYMVKTNPKLLSGGEWNCGLSHFCFSPFTN
ncbi:uncharacterized protein LOC135481758 isoform X2 [Liolophura sinensis]|uniref:uncharacterized protein LOC135481758 isoform X2 n=1 Tax=Liolophura sinensis TaxID=3198878 RepID=UPI003158607E